MIQALIKERVAEAEEVIEVGMKKESDSVSVALEEKIKVLKERMTEVANDESTSMVKKIALETEMDIERVKIELKTSAKQRERNLKDMTVIRAELLKLKEVGSSQQLEVENLEEIIEKVKGQVVEVDERVTREIEVREKSVEEIRVRVQDQKDE